MGNKVKRGELSESEDGFRSLVSKDEKPILSVREEMISLEIVFVHCPVLLNEGNLCLEVPGGF